MPSRCVPACLVFLAVMLACKVVLAASCLVDPDPQARDNDTRIGFGDPKKLKSEEKLSRSKQFPDCSELVLVKGVMHVLYETPDGVRRQTCKDAGKPCPINTGTWPSWLDLFTYQPRPDRKSVV